MDAATQARVQIRQPSGSAAEVVYALRAAGVNVRPDISTPLAAGFVGVVALDQRAAEDDPSACRCNSCSR